MKKDNTGLNAGIIWRLLNDNKSWSANDLIKETGLSQKEVYCAIGWLARENKIEIKESDSGDEHFYLIIEYYF